MNSSVLTRIWLYLFVFLTSNSIFAATDHGHHKAHVHGVSELKLAIDTQNIDIHFQSPANNIVGFEHSAISKKEKQRVKKATEILSNPALLFLFGGTDCTATSSSIDMGGLLDSHNKHTQQDAHNEITAHYRFQCQSISQLNHIEIQLFNQFTIISEINAQWISEIHQGMSTLTPDNTQLVINK